MSGVGGGFSYFSCEDVDNCVCCRYRSVGGGSLDCELFGAGRKLYSPHRYVFNVLLGSFQVFTAVI